MSVRLLSTSATPFPHPNSTKTLSAWLCVSTKAFLGASRSVCLIHIHNKAGQNRHVSTGSRDVLTKRHLPKDRVGGSEYCRRPAKDIEKQYRLLNGEALLDFGIPAILESHCFENDEEQVL